MTSRYDVYMTEKERRLERLQNVVNDVWAGYYGVGHERVVRLGIAGYDYIQHLVNITAKRGGPLRLSYI